MFGTNVWKQCAANCVRRKQNPSLRWRKEIISPFCGLFKNRKKQQSISHSIDRIRELVYHWSEPVNMWIVEKLTRHRLLQFLDRHFFLGYHLLHYLHLPPTHTHIYRHKNTLYIMFLYMFCLPNGFQFIPWTKRTHMQQNHRDGHSYFANI